MNINEMFLSYNQSYPYNYPYEYDYNYYNSIDPFLRQPISNGTRVKDPMRQEIYLIDKGTLRFIPSTAVYHGIFRDWKGLHSVNLQNFPKGPPLREGTMLFKYPDDPTVYLRDWENGRTQVKRRIVSANAFNRWHFDWKKINTIARTARYPDGTPIK